jgi:hypothetical protein
MPRRATVWLLTLPLAVVGSQVAHSLAYRVVESDRSDRAHELASTGHGYLTYLPLVLAVCTVIVAVALLSEVRQALSHKARSPRPAAVTFAIAAPSLFILQEHFERFFDDGAFPWGLGVEPVFLLGLLLQLPTALVAYVAARLLLRAAHAFGLLLSPQRRRLLPGRPVPRFSRPWYPRVSILALGYGSRGPPDFHV